MSEFEKLINYCRTNNLNNLSKLVPNLYEASAIISDYKFGTTSREKVPLLCISIENKALDCIKYLLKNGANKEASDGVNNFF